MNRRQFLKKSAVVIANSALIGLPAKLNASPAVQTKKEVRIGIYGASHCAAPLIFAEQKGYFKQEGIKVKLINYPNMPSLVKDLLSGGLEMGQ
ncbi:MAG: ABC transporter substrate-binding protein, partial [Nitrospirae bacterium]|nr:ABC transporter substrate-binding protein [Nitrospirota bacterium]